MSRPTLPFVTALMLLSGLFAAQSTPAPQEQLGLRLEPRQAPMDVFVIESAERPTEE